MNPRLASAIAFTALASVSVQAQTAAPDGPFQNPCHASPATDFDFWVGDWVAFDSNTGVVQGIDKIHKTNNGCVLVQDWSQMTDRYRAPGADFRYAGMSFNSVLPDGRWQQVWVGNYGGTITLAGGLDEAGRMVISSEPSVSGSGQTFKRTWYWEKLGDDEVHSWGEIRTQNDDGSWSEPTVPWDIRYVRRAVSPNLVAGETD